VSNRTTDYLVIGGGIVGLTLALALRRREPSASVLLIEKEDELGLHASGRNSGVLHAGFYYTADSLKARFSRDGNRWLTDFCERLSLPINRCGKLVVARTEAEHAGLDELLRRGQRNGVELLAITEREALELDPSCRTSGRALFSPTTSSVDPVAVMQALTVEALGSGIAIETGNSFVRRIEGNTVETASGRLEAGYIINAAGLYADRIARQFGFSSQYRILPFRGLYLKDRSGTQALRRHIYPVPELKYPFLGVHFTVQVDGKAKIGPTATPAVWREQYGGVSGISAREISEIGGLQSRLFLSNAFEFRTLARRELPKALKRVLHRRAGSLVSTLQPARMWSWGKPGIRAQLVDVQEMALVMDFRYEGDARSLHVLNAVSPAFTCAMPFSEHLVSEIESLSEGRRVTEPRPAEVL